MGDELKGPLADGVAAASDAIGGLADQIEAHGLKSIIPKERLPRSKILALAAKTVAGGGLKVLGASAKFLGENMQTVLPLVTSLLVTFKGYKAITATVATFRTMQTAMTGASTGMTLLGTAVKIFTGHTMAATTATGALKVGIAALGGPVGVAALAIGALTAGAIAYKMTLPKVVTESERFADSCAKLHDEQQKFSKTARDLNATNEKSIDTTKAQGVEADNYFKKLKSLVGVEKKSAGQKKQISAIVAKLNGLLPGLNAHYDEEKDKLDKTTAAIKRNIKAQKALVMAKAYQKGMEANAEKLADAEIKYEEAIKKRSKAEKDGEAAANKHKELYDKYMEDGSISADEDKALDKYSKKMEDNAAAYYEADKAANGYKDTINDLTGKMSAYEEKMDALNNFADYTNNINKLAKEAGIKAKEIPKTIGESIKEGIYEAPQSWDET